MRKIENLIGKSFGKLTVIKEDSAHIYPSGRARRKFIVKCDCGKEVSMMINNLRTGGSTTCGCERTERCRMFKFSHGLSRHPINRLWNGIKSRCYNSKSEFFHCYGGKGIRVYELWLNDFKAFYDWCVANGWQKGLSIERKDINKDYSPDNCCFIKLADQANNRTNTWWIDICGERKNATQWSNVLGLNRNTVLQRLRKGINPLEALGLW